MKKIVISFMSVIMIFSFSACGQTVETAKSTPTEQSQAATTSSVAPSTVTQVSESSVEEQASDTANKDVLFSVVEYFKTNGFAIGGKSEKLAAMIGAKNGFGIELNGNKIELYEYDTQSKEELAVTNLKTAKEGYIDMSGFKINVTLNGNLVLAGYDEHPDKDKIIEMFKSYK